MDYLGCYVCQDKIFDEVKDMTDEEIQTTFSSHKFKPMRTSLGGVVLPKENFSSVGVCVANANGDKVDYSTPVCTKCNSIVCDEANAGTRQLLFNRLLEEIRKNDFGPNYISREKSVLLFYIKDISNELKENGVI